jgi:hypothetical protein
VYLCQSGDVDSYDLRDCVIIKLCCLGRDRAKPAKLHHKSARSRQETVRIATKTLARTHAFTPANFRTGSHLVEVWNKQDSPLAGSRVAIVVSELES